MITLVASIYKQCFYLNKWRQDDREGQTSAREKEAKEEWNEKKNLLT